MGRLGARPHSRLDTVKPVTTVISISLRPKKLDSQPEMGRMMALATRYEVSTQVASSTVAERLPAMCGRLTFTTEVSSTSMVALDITAMATSHLRVSGRNITEFAISGQLPSDYLGMVDSTLTRRSSMGPFLR